MAFRLVATIFRGLLTWQFSLIDEALGGRTHGGAKQNNGCTLAGTHPCRQLLLEDDCCFAL